MSRLDTQAPLLTDRPLDDDPIVIVGVACRLPGGIDSPELLWQALETERDVAGPFPDDRGWALDTLISEDPDEIGTTYSQGGSFIEDVGDFDAGFFGIAPREANAMDPQHRLVLEVAWEALERAHIDPTTLHESETGVFIGEIFDDYRERFITPEGGMGEHEGHLLLGNARCVLSGRLAYALGLNGPAITFDTGCSASLVALHHAMLSLKSGDCDLAIVGGVTVMSAPSFLIGFSRVRGIAADGRSKSFGADADGMGLAEGASLCIIERRSDALRRGHPILAVVRGSSVNQDGASGTLTAPSQRAQELLIGKALRNAGLGPADVDVVEAHGTGTSIGDPIEARALMNTYGRERPEDAPLWLGSVKSNIGHTQAAAGMAGVIKMIGAMQHDLLPRTLHVEQPSPEIDWTAGNVALLAEHQAWPPSERPRRAGISSFGVGGTNAHVIIEEPGARDVRAADDSAAPQDAPTAVPLLLSAKSAAALRSYAGRLRGHLLDGAAGDPAAGDPADVAWSLLNTRSLFRHRAAVVGGTAAELAEGLAAIESGGYAGNIAVGEATARRVAFVFPGQGSQWVGMGVDLLRSSEVFAAKIDECDEILAQHQDWSVRKALEVPDDIDWTRVDVIQPLLFSVNVALAALWTSWGVAPTAVIGHSQGELAALQVAGALSLADAGYLVAKRSQVIRAHARDGAMLAVEASAEQVRAELDGRPGLEIASINGPRTTVVAGDVAAVAELREQLERGGIEARGIAVDYASHTAHVDALKDELAAALSRDITVAAAPVRFYSAVTGEQLDTETLTADYWFDNLRQPVDFQRAVRTAIDDGCNAFIEVSAHPVLLAPLEQIVEDRGSDAVVVGTLSRDRGTVAKVAGSAATLHCAGADVDFTALFPDWRRPTVDLPTYPFERIRHWLEPEQSRRPLPGATAVDHPFLTMMAPLAAGPSTAFFGAISPRDELWLSDHAVRGNVLVPGTAFLDMALFVADRLGYAEVEELTVVTPLLLEEDGDTVDVQVVVEDALSENTAVENAGADCASITIYSRDGEADWTVNAMGLLRRGAAAPGDGPSALIDAAAWPPADVEALSVPAMYDDLSARGYEYGPAFRGLSRAWTGAGRAYAEIQAPAALGEVGDRTRIHPAVLDAGLHAGVAGFGDGSGAEVLLPFSWRGVRMHRSAPDSLRMAVVNQGEKQATITVTDDAGQLVLTAKALELRAVPADTTLGKPSRLAYRLGWKRHDLPHREDPVPVLTLGAASGGVCGVEVLGHLEDMAALTGAEAAVTAGAGAVLYRVDAPAAEAAADAAADAVATVLADTQRFLADPALDRSTLVVVTSGAVGCRDADIVQPGSAAIWAFLRAAQREHPDRIVAVDVDAWDPPLPIGDLIGSGEPVAAVRGGQVYVPELSRLHHNEPTLSLPADADWHLLAGDDGLIDNIHVAADAADPAPLEPHQVRFAVRAAGLNFRDVLISLRTYAGTVGALGLEAAGDVLEIGSAVEDIAVGDRVFGYCTGGFGSIAIGDCRALAKIPADWGYPEAAALPVTFGTAYSALHDLAELTPDDRILIHSAASGVGMAAVGLAQHVGAEIYATSSPEKFPILRAMGIPEQRIASSRNADFEREFRAASGGRGMTVALDAFSGRMVDATLRLMAPEGRFVEIGRADIRDAREVAEQYSGVRYHVFDPFELGAEALGNLRGAVADLVHSGQWPRIPLRGWDIRNIREAFRLMSTGRHTGKHVVINPASMPAVRGGTVLITGGTGMVGRHLARHLVARWGVGRVVLLSRSGPAAAMPAEFVEQLRELGAEVELRACDVADAESVAHVVADVAAAHRVVGVVHAAGVLDDGVLESMDAERITTVFDPKANGAWNLHAATRQLDLEFFVMCSSVAGVFGSPGQTNYAAANGYLDGLAAWRRAHALPATSIAWGLWSDSSSLTAKVLDSGADSIDRLGVRGFSPAEAVAAFDEALLSPGASTLVVRMEEDAASLLKLRTTLPPKRSRSTEPARRPADPAAAPPLREVLAAAAPEAREDLTIEAVCREIAATVGMTDQAGVDPDCSYRELGFDSLMAVEFRNRLNSLTGLRLPAAVVLDQPTPRLLAQSIVAALQEEAGDPASAPGELAAAR